MSLTDNVQPSKDDDNIGASVLPRLRSKVLEILIPLLQSTNENQSIRNAVGEINKLYPLKIKDFPEADEPDDFLWVFYALLFKIVRRIPYNHPKQERLIDFLMKWQINLLLWRVPESPSPEDHSE